MYIIEVFRDNITQINNESILPVFLSNPEQLRHETEQPVKVYRVCVGQEVVVPPLSVTLASVETDSPPMTDFVIHPQQDIEGLLVPYSLVGRDKPMVLVRSPTNHTITLRKNKFLGTAIEMHDVESQPIGVHESQIKRTVVSEEHQNETIGTLNVKLPTHLQDMF